MNREFSLNHSLKIKLQISVVLVMGLSLAACSEEQQALENCIQPAPWTLSVAGAGDENHDSNVSISRTETIIGGTLTGLAQPIAGREIVHQFTVPDLGENGSVTLSADMVSFPGELVGSAYPVLVSLNDGVNELVNLSRSGSGNDCAQSGFFSCPGGSCSVNPSCVVNSPSAFVDRNHWQQYQIPPYGYSSTNTFPNCQWNSGSPTCAFNQNFFQNNKLRSGTYTARYVLLTSNYSSVSNFVGRAKITTIMKSDSSYSNNQNNGALALNLIMVGSKNISDAREVDGQTKMEEVLAAVQGHYNQSRPGLKLGSIQGYEWSCSESSEAFSQVEFENIGEMIRIGSRSIPKSREGKAINVFFVSSIPSSIAGTTILGVSGGIQGPPVNGSGTSGVVVATADRLLTMSIAASTGRTFSETITHELGHYLGLNHPSEREGDLHDYLPDTVECPTIDGIVTHTSCRQLVACSSQCNSTYCPTVAECQFNLAMWRTSKNFNPSTGVGDGNIFTNNTSRIVNFSSFAH